MDCSSPGSSVHGIFQAKVLEWVAISFSRGSSQPRDQTQVSCIIEDALPSELPGKPLLSASCVLNIVPDTYYLKIHNIAAAAAAAAAR